MDRGASGRVSVFAARTMPTFHANEFSAVLPEGLKDRTVNVFTLTDEGPSDLSVVVTRDVLRGAEGLPEYVDRQLAVLQERLAGLRIRRREPATLAGHAAESLEFSWQSREGTVWQRLVIAPSLHGTILSFSATFRAAPAAPHTTMFESFLANMRLNPPEG